MSGARWFDTKEEEIAFYSRGSKQSRQHTNRLTPPVGKPAIGPPQLVQSRRPTTAADLTKTAEATEWIVEDFGAEGALVILAAESGTGKTTLLYQMAAAISEGADFLGQLKTQKRKVLVVQADESKRNAGDKVHLMGIESNNVHFRFPEDDTRWSSLDIGLIRDQIALYGYGVIILDSMTTLLTGGCSIKEAEFAKPLYELNQVASSHKALIIISAHLRKTESGEKRHEIKADDVIGTGIQQAAASDTWGLWRAKKQLHDDHFVLGCLGKRNCDESARWDLQGSQEDFTWEIVQSSNNDLLPSEKASLKEQILNLLNRADEWMTTNQISGEVCCNMEHCRRCVRELFRTGKIESKKKKQGNGRPLNLYKGFPTQGGGIK